MILYSFGPPPSGCYAVLAARRSFLGCLVHLHFFSVPLLLYLIFNISRVVFTRLMLEANRVRVLFGVNRPYAGPGHGPNPA